jgi:signal peptidase I
MRGGRAVGLAVAGVLGGVLALPLLALLIVLVLTLTHVTHLYGMPNAAMEPTLHCARPARACEASQRDRLFVVKYFFSNPGRSDIVAFRPPAGAQKACGARGVFVGRIVGMPGETWQEQRGRVFIDRLRLVEPYVKRPDTGTRKARTIPGRSYFVLGDDRTASCDSREWGPLPRSDIVGRVIATYWPPSRIALH